MSSLYIFLRIVVSQIVNLMLRRAISFYLECDF